MQETAPMGLNYDTANAYVLSETEVRSPRV